MFSDYVVENIPAVKYCFANRASGRKLTAFLPERSLFLIRARLKGPSVNLDKWCFSTIELRTLDYSRGSRNYFAALSPNGDTIVISFRRSFSEAPVHVARFTLGSQVSRRYTARLIRSVGYSTKSRQRRNIA